MFALAFPLAFGVVGPMPCHNLSRILNAMGRAHVVALRQNRYRRQIKEQLPLMRASRGLERGKKVIVGIESVFASTDRLTKGQYRVNPRT